MQLGNDAKNASTIPTLSPSEASTFIVGAYLAGTHKRMPIFKGSPGLGKSAMVKQAADELRKIFPDFGFVNLHPTMPHDEVGGIPELIRKEGEPTRTDYALPKWFPLDPASKGIINLDDVAQSDKLMQQVMANLVHDRSLRGYPLPDGWMIVGSGNRVEDGAGVVKTLTHFNDRICDINIAAHVASWVEDFAIPNGIDERIIAYVLSDETKLDQFDPKVAKCATPRSWEAVSNWLKFIGTLPEDKQTKMAQVLLAGEIGQGEAIRFWAFCQLFGRMPDIDAILADPLNASIEHPLDIQYALVISIAQKLDPNNLQAALQYVDRLGTDLTVLMLKVGMSFKPELQTSQAFLNWSMNNQAALRAA